MGEQRHEAVADEGSHAAEYNTVVVGAGLGGIGAVLRLLKAGVGPILMIEKHHEVGGVWSTNTYPGCACDIPGHLYAFSFENDWDWSSSYPGQKEILAYFKSVVAKHRLEERGILRLNTSVEKMTWREDLQRWDLLVQEKGRTGTTTVTTQFVATSTGVLCMPAYPKVTGMEKFKGVAMHTAQWKNDVDLTGKRVAVVGTGASAVQVVGAIAPIVSHLTIMQRTAPWLFDKPDFVFSERSKKLLRNPWLRTLFRLSIYVTLETLCFPLGIIFGPKSFLTGLFRIFPGYLAEKKRQTAVPDPELRAKLKPNFDFGCKRLLMSSEFYECMSQDNVELVAAGVTAVTKDGIVDSNGVNHPVDVIVWATGFNIEGYFLAKCKAFGRGGKTWAELMGDKTSHACYMCTMTPGLPNMFIIQGPNQGTGHHSVSVFVEAQMNLVIDIMKKVKAAGATTVEVKPEANDSYVKWMKKRVANTVFMLGGCVSWYQREDGGHTDIMWPGTAIEWELSTLWANINDFMLADASGKPVVVTGQHGLVGTILRYAVVFVAMVSLAILLRDPAYTERVMGFFQ